MKTNISIIEKQLQKLIKAESRLNSEISKMEILLSKYLDFNFFVTQQTDGFCIGIDIDGGINIPIDFVFGLLNTAQRITIHDIKQYSI